jgi:hypothetical protein
LRVLIDTALLLTVAGLPSFRDKRLLASGAVVVLAAINGAVFASDTATLLAIGVPLTGLSVAAAWVLSPVSFRAQVLGVIGYPRSRSDSVASPPADDRIG